MNDWCVCALFTVKMTFSGRRYPLRCVLNESRVLFSIAIFLVAPLVNTFCEILYHLYPLKVSPLYLSINVTS